MILDVSSTRMELMKLKKKNEVSIKGHKLLKDKLDELIRILLNYIKEWNELNEKIIIDLAEIRGDLRLSEYLTSRKIVRSAFQNNTDEIKISTISEKLLNIEVPLLEIDIESHDFPQYGFLQSSSAMDKASVKIKILMTNMVKLAEKEMRLSIISDEVLSTRRRVNALEHYMIPNIQETIKSISMKLEEQDRNSKSQLMRIKDIIRAPKIRSSGNPGGFKFQD